MKKKIAIIGTNGLPGRYGGWDQLLNNLTSQLSYKYDITVYTSSHDAVKGLKEYNGAKIKIIPLKANGYQSILYDAISMVDAGFKYDDLLVLGTSGCVFLPIIRLFKKRIILNPDGAEWKRKKWNTFIKWFLKKSEEFGIRFSDEIIADNKIIQDFILQSYNKTSHLITYGGDNAKYILLGEDTKSKYGIDNENYAFKVCRIEPENNIDIILESFVDVNFKLIIVGNWNYSAYGKNLREKYSKSNNMMLLDPIYDQATLDELRANCGIYLHGHSVGGTNPSLVEAMNLGLYCAVFDVNYNRETTENSANYFKNSEDLRNLVKGVLSKTVDTTKNREKMKEIAVRRYAWSDIVAQYDQVFSKV